MTQVTPAATWISVFRTRLFQRRHVIAILEARSQSLHGLRDEHVADAPHGLDRLGLVGIVLDPPAQARYSNVDAAIIGMPIAVLRQVQDLVARQDSVRAPS